MSYNLLLRDYRTPIKTPIKRLQHSYQEIAALLSRDYKTPINSYKSPIKRF